MTLERVLGPAVRLPRRELGRGGVEMQTTPWDRDERKGTKPQSHLGQVCGSGFILWWDGEGWALSSKFGDVLE
jgi:hypothetical protein